jgi:pseudooxynicotine dehydrogenase
MGNNSDQKAGSLNRRRFLSGAVLATSATALAPATSAQVPCATQCKTEGCDYDVIVIGGGFAGVTAARDSQKNGLKTLLLEARNRLGGRTFSTDFEGSAIELGGTWIHNTQPFVWAEAQRYGVGVFETPGAVPDMMQAVMPDGTRAVLGEDQIVEVVLGWEAYCAMAREILPRPYDLLYNKAAALAAEKISATEHLKSLDLTPLQVTFNEAMISVIVSNHASEMSYLEVLRFHLLGGGYFTTFMDSTTRFQIEGGTTALLNSILEDGGPDTRLATPVKAIRDVGDKVLVSTTRGEDISCGAVICTVPMNTINSIDFQPPLPQGVVEAGKEGHPGQGIKLYMKVEGELDNFASFAAHLPFNYLMTYKQAKGYSLVVGFSSGADQLDAYDEEAAQEALRQHLPGARVLSIMHYDWVNDPYSRGTWATYRTAWVEKYYHQFQQDSGRILFGSGDHGEGWRGTIDSAIGAGAIAARKARDIIS